MVDINYVCEACGKETKITVIEKDYENFKVAADLDALHIPTFKKLCMELGLCYSCFFSTKP